jgi:hypothetical protein
MHELRKPALDVVLRPGVERAHGSDQTRVARHHTHRGEITGVHRAQADDGGIDRAHIARDDRLRGGDDMSGYEDRIDGQMRIGARPAPRYGSRCISRGHHGPDARHLSGRKASASCAARKISRRQLKGLKRRRSSPCHRRFAGLEDR